MNTIGEVVEALQHKEQVSNWDFADELVSATFLECPTCKTMNGFLHKEDCVNTPVREPRTVFSHHGHVTYLDWCLIEVDNNKGWHMWVEYLDNGRMAVCVSRKEREDV